MSDWFIPSNPDFDKSELPCSICCLEVESYGNITIMDPCGHMCCTDCFKSLNSKCHVCRAHPVRKMTLGKHVAKLFLKGSFPDISGYCRFCDPEKKTQQPYSDLLLHECKNRPKPCEYKCGKLIFPKEMHKCPKKPEPCGICGRFIMNAEFAEHLVTCSDLHIMCEFCKKYFEKKQIRDHEIACEYREWKCHRCVGIFRTQDYYDHSYYDCPNRLVECKFCRIVVLFRDLDPNHYESECSKCTKCKHCNKVISNNPELEIVHLVEHCKKIDVCIGCYQYYFSIDEFPSLPEGKTIHLCPYEEIKCLTTGCNARIKRKDFSQHICPRLTPTDCEYKCGLKIKKAEMWDHLSICPKQPKFCFGCIRQYSPDLFADHQKICAWLDTCRNCWETHGGVYRVLGMNEVHFCKFRIVNCDICNKKMYENELETHKKTCKPFELKECPICQVEFTAAELRIHLYEHVKPTSITKCEHCLSLVNVDDFSRHQMVCGKQIHPKPTKKTSEEKKNRCGKAYKITDRDSTVVRGIQFSSCVTMEGYSIRSQMLMCR